MSEHNDQHQGETEFPFEIQRRTLPPEDEGTVAGTLAAMETILKFVPDGHAPPGHAHQSNLPGAYEQLPLRF